MCIGALAQHRKAAVIGQPKAISCIANLTTWGMLTIVADFLGAIGSGTGILPGTQNCGTYTLSQGDVSFWIGLFLETQMRKTFGAWRAFSFRLAVTIIYQHMENVSSSDLHFWSLQKFAFIDISLRILRLSEKETRVPCCSEQKGLKVFYPCKYLAPKYFWADAHRRLRRTTRPSISSQCGRESYWMRTCFRNIFIRFFGTYFLE